MKNVIALIMILSVIAISAINKISYPYTFTGQTSPKVTWLDADFLTAKNVINQSIDTINRLRDTTFKYLYGRSYTGSGAVVNASAPTIVNPSISGALLTDATIDTIINSPVIDTIKGVMRIEPTSSNQIEFPATAELWARGKFYGGDAYFIDSIEAGYLKANSFSGNDVRVDDSIKGVTGEYSGRVKATDFESSDSIIGESGLFGIGKINTQTTTTTSGRTAFTLNLKTSGDMANGHGALLLWSIADDQNVENSIGIISTVRNGADNTGKMRFDVYESGTRYQNLTYTKNDLSMTGRVSSDSSRVKATYIPIRTINSSGTTNLTKENSFVTITTSGVTANLPDANGSGFILEICTTGNSANVSPFGDVIVPILCSPSGTLALGATCGAAAKYHGTCARFIDCANNTWCVFPTYE